jgi:tRNA-Thr(GGU) m(6)t(6)A37 methyltransferase TsaA
MTVITLTPIGVVKCPVTEMSRGNWASIDSEIHMEPEYVRGLNGLEGFSHVIVVFYLHQIGGFDPRTQLLRRPRGMENVHEVGVFAQRTKYRPNPIGVTAVELRGIAGNVLAVRGLDALDGTPVVDIKPYIPAFDRVAEPRTPAWVASVMEGYF